MPTSLDENARHSASRHHGIRARADRVPGIASATSIEID
jgi:hypothetical protein